MKLQRFLCAMLGSMLLQIQAYANETEGVVVTIKPLHSLVSMVMGDTGQAKLLLDGVTSPHDFQLKPSQMRSLQQAAIVFYVDESFETFLHGAFETLPAPVRKAPIIRHAEVTFFTHRKGGAWETHDHETEGHYHDHGDDAHTVAHDDMHIWLAPDNAGWIIEYITRELSALYPENRDVYQANARAAIAVLEALDAELGQMLAPVRDIPFIVFHDAYQYLEYAYGLKAVGSITLEPDESPVPSRLRDVRRKLIETDARCVFREPQFTDRLINTIIEGTHAKRGTLDPLGVDIPAGAGHYPQLMQRLAQNLKACLG